MKNLISAIQKNSGQVFEPYKENGSLYYVSASVDETDEDRETAKKEYPFILNANLAFGCVRIFKTFDDASEAALRFLRKWRDWAMVNGYQSVGEIHEEWESDYNDWAYADFTHDNKPIRLRAEVHTLSY